MNKTFDFTRKQNWEDPFAGESGKFIDHFLYNSNTNAVYIILMNSSRSSELMKKSYFTNDLTDLKKVANDIVSKQPPNNNQGNDKVNNNSINNLSTLSSGFKIKTNLDDDEYTKLRDVGAYIYY